MLDFHRLTNEDAPRYANFDCFRASKGCEYSFPNLRIWGRQKVAFVDGFAAFFSQFDRVSIYPFPLGQGDMKHMLDLLIHDAKTRGIPCRLSSMSAEDCATVERLYPGRFQFHTDRDYFDYIYRIEDLAALKGKRYQSKRNFVNRFRLAHPSCVFEPLTERNMHLALELAQQWFAEREKADPNADLQLEKIALERAFRHFEALRLEGMVALENGKPLAMTVGSPMTENTFDIHFEKALSAYPGAYAAINQAFASYLQNKYPNLVYLDREDDMGIPGLRQAKLSYHPDHMVEKYWARLWEDDDEH